MEIKGISSVKSSVIDELNRIADMLKYYDKMLGNSISLIHVHPIMNMYKARLKDIYENTDFYDNDTIELAKKLSVAVDRVITNNTIPLPVNKIELGI